MEAGAVVSDVLDVLDGHNLTLQNFSSIKEQQIGGWTQVGAHGTGATLSTVDEMITKLKQIKLKCVCAGVLSLLYFVNPRFIRGPGLSAYTR